MRVRLLLLAAVIACGCSVFRMRTSDRNGTPATACGGACDGGGEAPEPKPDPGTATSADEDEPEGSGSDRTQETAARKAGAHRSSGPRASARSGRNLVLITVDTLRIDLGFMGYSSPVSPSLDALASRSTVFERAYSMASYTGKSVGPMMIGKYASECHRNGAHFDAYGPENTLLAERLQNAGFHTMGIASHWYFKPKYGLAQGMDTWDLSAIGGSEAPVYTLVTSETLTDLAIGQLSNAANVDGRFFLWVHYFDPHQRYVRHAEAPDFSRPDRNPNKALYDGEVWFTDHHLGRLLDYIASQPWADRTVIVITSDHGETFGEHGMTGHGVDLWEPLVRVPLVIYVPGVAPHRVHVKRSLVDMVPTLLDLLQLPQPPPGELSGKSTATAILEPDKADTEERDVYLDMPVGPQVHEHRGIIHGPTPGMKLIWEGGPVFFLFDLEKDAHEARDLAGNRKVLAPIMKSYFDKLASLHEQRVPGPGTATAVR